MMTLEVRTIIKKADEIYEHLFPEKRSSGHRYRKNLADNVSTAVAVIGIIGAIFFLSLNITGNVIGNLTNSTSNIIGVVSLVVGLVAGFFYFKRK